MVACYRLNTAATAGRARPKTFSRIAENLDRWLARGRRDLSVVLRFWRVHRTGYSAAVTQFDDCVASLSRSWSVNWSPQRVVRTIASIRYAAKRVQALVSGIRLSDWLGLGGSTGQLWPRFVVRARHQGAGAKQERAAFLWLLELRSTDFNGPMLCRKFSVSAGQRIARTWLGVKGSQVQILSSRRSTSPLTWSESSGQRASFVQWFDLA